MEAWSNILERFPWVPDVLSWMVILVLLFLTWLMIGFPMLLVERFVRGKRESFSAFLAESRKGLDQYEAHCEQRTVRQLKEFLESRRHFALANLTFSFWNNPVRTASRAAKKIERRYSKATRKIGKLVHTSWEDFIAASKRIENLNLEDLEKKLPDPKPIVIPIRVHTDYIKARREWIVYSVLLVAVFFANAVMLSQILKGIQVGYVRLWGGLWLYHVLSFLMTVPEACLGAIWSGNDQNPEHTEDGGTRRKSWSRALAYGAPIGAIVLAIVEGFFYAQFGGVDTEGSMALGGITLTLTNALTLWGVALPLILFAVGHLWHRCFGQMANKAGLMSLKTVSTRLRDRLPNMKAQLSAVQTATAKATSSLPHYRDDADKNVVTAIDQLRETLDSLQRRVGDRQEVTGASLTDGDIWRGVRRVVVIFVMALMMGWLAFWLGKETIGTLFPNLSEDMPLFLSVALVLVWPAIGIHMQSTERAVDERKNVVAGLSLLGRTPALLAMTILLMASGYVLIEFAVPNGMGVVWAIMMGIHLVLMVLGNDLPDVVGIVRYFLSTLWSQALLLVRRGGLLLLRVILGMVRLIEILTELVALPAKWAMQMSGQGK